MRRLSISPDTDRLVVQVLGAHCDDIEIGAGGLLLSLAARRELVVVGTILTSDPVRETESRAALAAFAPGATIDLEVLSLRDGRLPGHWDEVKEAVERARHRGTAHGGTDLVVGPSKVDAHQDHRLLAEILPTTFRDHLILGYEILKYDGDMSRPNTYVEVAEYLAARKAELLDLHYASQRGRTWFDRETFLALMRVRGVECNCRYAEAFHVGKALLEV